MQSRKMDLFNLWLPIIGVGIFAAIAIGAWFADHKLTAIWFGFFAAVCVLLLAALQLQEHEIGSRQSDAPAKPVAAPPVDYPIVLPVDIGIIRVHLPSGVTAAPHVQFK